MIVWFHNKISICWRDIFLIFHDLVMMLVSAIIYEILSYSYFLFFSWFCWIFEIFHYFLNSSFSSFQMETGKQTPRGEGSPGKGTYGKIPLGGLLSLGSPPLAPKLGLNVSVLVGYSLPNKIAYPTPTKRIHISLLAQQDCTHRSWMAPLKNRKVYTTKRHWPR